MRFTMLPRGGMLPPIHSTDVGTGEHSTLERMNRGRIGDQLAGKQVPGTILPMNAFLRAWSILIVAVKRLLAQRGLALATLLGLVAAVALTTSIPLYAEAVYYRVLSEGLFSDATGYKGDAIRPPVTLLFRYVGSFTGPVQWEALQLLNAYADYDLYRDLRLPPSPELSQVRMVNTGILGIYTAADIEVVTTKPPLGFQSPISLHVSTIFMTHIG